MRLPCQSLAAAFADVPDPRRAASVTYPLAAVLALAVSAIPANHLSVLALAPFGDGQHRDLVDTLGFPDGRTPCQSTLQHLFRQMEGDALAAMLTQCFAPSAVPTDETDGPQGIAIDGKAQRGRLRFPDGTGAVHALSAFCHESGIVLAHDPITAPVGLEKGEAELTVAPVLLDRVDWHGRVLTGDALFCQRHLCQQVCDAGGDYLVVVKENQGPLYRDIHLLFDPPTALARMPMQDRRLAHTMEAGHRRGRERRAVIASTDLTAYLAWSGLAQVMRIERTWREHGQAKGALHYAITSLSTRDGPPDRLLALKRGHWSIENRLHRCKDVNFGEDASLIHVGQGPTVMALLRDAAVSLLHRAGVRRVAVQLRALSQQPEAAVALVVAPLRTDA